MTYRNRQLIIDEIDTRVSAQIMLVNNALIPLISQVQNIQAAQNIIIGQVATLQSDLAALDARVVIIEQQLGL